MKARVSPVQSIEPYRILAPTRDSNPGPPGPESKVVTTILPLHTYVCTNTSAPLFFIVVNVFPHVKPPWQVLNHLPPWLQTSGMHCQIIFRAFQLFLLLEELPNILFLLAYPDSSAKSGEIKPVQCITLGDTAPTTAIAHLRNKMPPI